MRKGRRGWGWGRGKREEGGDERASEERTRTRVESRTKKASKGEAAYTKEEKARVALVGYLNSPQPRASR